MMFNAPKELLKFIEGKANISKEKAEVTDESTLKSKVIDDLVYNMALNPSEAMRNSCSWLIWEIGRSLGIYPSSIQSFYEAMGKGECGGFTVPAVNIRGMTYDIARALIRTALKNKAGAFIFEIARSEIDYTFQRPTEYGSICLAAAIKEGLRGPLFIQGDHFQANAKRYTADSHREVEGLKNLVKEAIDAGFYNIDIDTSTLVDLSKPNVTQQQQLNFEIAAQLTAFIRNLQPVGITISVGGEIGEVGKKNSTPEELRTFMDGYRKTLTRYGKGFKGISKISVQTGTAHGGVVLADGSIAKVKLDFDTLKALSKIAREEYGLCGAVQHGASTLPEEAFHRFPETETAEVHLATGFQNIIYESTAFPKDLRKRMYDWMKTECASEKKEDQTAEQFIYQTRKKAFGPFKTEIMNLPQSVRDSISAELETQFDFLFKKLNIINTQQLIKQYIQIKEVKRKIPQELAALL